MRGLLPVSRSCAEVQLDPGSWRLRPWLLPGRLRAMCLPVPAITEAGAITAGVIILAEFMRRGLSRRGSHIVVGFIGVEFIVAAAIVAARLIAAAAVASRRRRARLPRRAVGAPGFGAPFGPGVASAKAGVEAAPKKAKAPRVNRVNVDTCLILAKPLPLYNGQKASALPGRGTNRPSNMTLSQCREAFKVAQLAIQASDREFLLSERRRLLSTDCNPKTRQLGLHQRIHGVDLSGLF